MRIVDDNVNSVFKTVFCIYTHRYIGGTKDLILL